MVTPQLPPESEHVVAENETVPVPGADQLTVSPLDDKETVAVQVVVPPTRSDADPQETEVLVGATPEAAATTVMEAVFVSVSTPG